MVSILDDSLLVSSNKQGVESNWDFSRPKYVVITSVSTSVSKSFDILRTGGGGNDNEKETLTFRARTNSCTSKPTTVHTADNTSHKKDKNNNNNNMISSFEDQHGSEERKTTKAIIAQETRTTKQQRSSFRRHSLDSRHNNNSIIVIACSTQNKNDTINTNTIIASNNDDEGNMMRLSTINDNPWWKEQEPCDDRDGTDDLSPQMIRTTTDLEANKNNIDIIIPSDVHRQEEIGVELENERRDEKEEKICFLFENAKTFLEQIYKVKVSRQDKANNKVFISDHDIDTTKDSTEDDSAPSDCDHNSYHLNDSEVDDGDEDDDEEDDEEDDDDDDGDDSTSNASSSSSSVFEFFDDMSILTNEDSTGSDDDGKDTTTNNNNDFHVDLRTFEDTPLLPEDIGKTEEKDLHFMVYSFTKGDDLCEDHRSIEDLIIAGEKNSCKALDKDHVPPDFLVGFCYEDGFSSKDELRMA